MSNHETKFGVMSRHQQGKQWWFDTKEERDAFALELSKDGFEARHGVYEWTPEQFLPEEEKTTGFYKKHGNHWR